MPAFKKIKQKDIGAPTKLTEELIEDVCKVLKSGVFVETAVVMCNIGKTTFYRWIKESHKAEEELELVNAQRKKDKKKPLELKKRDALKVLFRNAVAMAMEEATIRDVINIDKCAMGKKPVYDRYPKGSIIPARDDKGKVQLDEHGQPIMIDVSGQIITDYKGKPIIADHGMPPDWRASAWRLEKRYPEHWGSVSTIVMDRKDPLEKPENDDSEFRITFVKPVHKEEL